VTASDLLRALDPVIEAATPYWRPKSQ